jgi:thiamine-phosphate pyrophosphorylase
VSGPRFRLYLVSDRRIAPGSLPEVLDAALAGAPPGTVGVQLREKDLDGRELYRLAEAVRRVTARRGAVFLVNDRADVARAVGADGVHLPAGGLPVPEVRRVFPGALVGVSAHAAEEVARARAQGADFAVLGPVFDTPSKRGFGPPLGLEELSRASRLGLAVYAIGGITPARTPPCLAAGAQGVACISAVIRASNPAAAVKEFLRAAEGG